MPIRDARTNLIIFPERDATLTPFARKLLEDFYLRPGETPQEGYARAAKAWSGGKDDLAHKANRPIKQVLGYPLVKDFRQRLSDVVA